jgi:hypothetical protein
MAEVCQTAESLAETAAVADAQMNAELAKAAAGHALNPTTAPRAEA